MLRHSAALALLVLPWDVVAQVGPELTDVWTIQEPMPLSAAIAEIRKSPFHAVAWPAGGLDGTLSRAKLRSALAPDPYLLRYQVASEDTPVSSGRVFVATSGIGLLAYLGTGFFLVLRTDSEVLFFSVPVVAVGVAAWVAGADPGRAAIGSILGGAIGIPIVFAEPFNNPLIDVGLGVVAHAAVTTLASRIHFRRRPRP